MSVQPHVAQARAVCLTQAMLMRRENETPAAIIARAQEFEAYVLRDNPDGAAREPGQAKLPLKGSRVAGQPQA